MRTPSRSTSTSPTWAPCQGMGEGWSSTSRESRLSRAAGKLDSTEGMRMRSPGAIRSGSAMPGFSRWISGQRSCEPRNWAAIPRSVSPGRTVCQPVASGGSVEAAGDTEAAGAAAAVRGGGAAGRLCAGRLAASSGASRSARGSAVGRRFIGCLPGYVPAPAAGRRVEWVILVFGSDPYTNALRG